MREDSGARGRRFVHPWRGRSGAGTAMSGRRDATKKAPASPPGPGSTRALEAYFAFANASVMSSMRLEKPHSLSYHESTLTSVPCMTRVCVES
jgi:hypothetical protein